MLFAGWFHYHKAAPKLAWFQDVEFMLNHHLAGLLGLGSLSWAGHQKRRGTTLYSLLPLFVYFWPTRTPTPGESDLGVSSILWAIYSRAEPYVPSTFLFILPCLGHKQWTYYPTYNIYSKD
ncbi:hypothetical protein MTR67_015116 [Solanum verrucosum]|uniref:Uncharacterized protein n=1 Tax=Solanum verrucosum TaxID=315347 RepID=A0AAF0QJE6_SOLVR|nr:hypothetical protein MTR67_015116 [Solanum verrucosum]